LNENSIEASYNHKKEHDGKYQETVMTNLSMVPKDEERKPVLDQMTKEAVTAYPESKKKES
jgi:hypothetical protein